MLSIGGAQDRTARFPRAVKSLITDFAKEATKPEYERIHDGYVYSVCERRFGVIRDGIHGRI